MSDTPPTLNINPPTVDPPAAPAEPPQAPPEPQWSQYAEELLGGVAEADRAVVEKYLGQWDAGVARRVSQVQQTYGPLIDYMGQSGYDLSDIQTAVEVYDALNRDPDGFTKAVQQAFETGEAAPPQPGQPNQNVMQMPPELVKNLGDMNKFMEQMALREEQREADQEAAAQDAALNDYLAHLEKEKGPFDMDYVLGQMAMGIDGAIAVDNFKTAVQKFGGGQPSPALPAPPVLHGGAAATGAKPISQATDAERRALVMQIISQANAQAS